MRFTSTLKKLSVLFMVFGALLMLSSCGAYQYVGYDNDGIYSSDEVVVDVNKAATNRTNDNYYANYFEEHVSEAQLLQDESEVFTDIDSYSSVTVVDNEAEIIEDYGGWGQVNDQVTINYYNTGWNNWGWGRNPWFWNYGFDYGWSTWGWNRWYGNIWYSPWAWNGGYGWGYNNWGWNNSITGIIMHTTIVDEEVFIIDLQYKMVEEIQRQEELQVITLVGQVSEVTLLLQDRLVEQ